MREVQDLLSIRPQNHFGGSSFGSGLLRAQTFPHTQCLTHMRHTDEERKGGPGRWSKYSLITQIGWGPVLILCFPTQYHCFSTYFSLLKDGRFVWRNLEASNKTRAGDGVSISSRHSNAMWQPKYSVTPSRTHWFLSPMYSGWLSGPVFLIWQGELMHQHSALALGQLCDWGWPAVGWGISAVLHRGSDSLAR